MRGWMLEYWNLAIAIHNMEVEELPLHGPKSPILFKCLGSQVPQYSFDGTCLSQLLEVLKLGHGIEEKLRVSLAALTLFFSAQDQSSEPHSPSSSLPT